jgi:hypothetical protein
MYCQESGSKWSRKKFHRLKIPRDELKSMSDHGAKAEIEVLCTQPVAMDGKLPLVSYLEHKMQIYF